MPILINEIAIRINVNQNGKDKNCGDGSSKDAPGNLNEAELVEALAEKVFEMIQSKKER